MQKPELNEIHIDQALERGRCTVTMSPGQWDALLDAAYNHGWLILEMDHRDRPKRAYRKAGSC